MQVERLECLSSRGDASYVSAFSGSCSRASHHHPSRVSAFSGPFSKPPTIIQEENSSGQADIPCLKDEAPTGVYSHHFKAGRANLHLSSSAGFPAYQLLGNAAWWLLNVKVSPLELPEAVIAYLILPWSSFVVAGNQLGLSPHGEIWQPHTLVWGRTWPCWNVKLHKIFF